MQTKAVIVLQLAFSVPASAQLAPVPSHVPGRSSSPRAVAHVNGVSIGADELEVALGAIIPLSSYHQNVKPDKLEELRARALDGLIDEELRYQDAVRMKLVVAPAEVEAALDRARGTPRGPRCLSCARASCGRS